MTPPAIHLHSRSRATARSALTLLLFCALAVVAAEPGQDLFHPDTFAYHTYGRMMREVDSLVGLYPSIARIETIALTTTGNRAVIAVKISDNPDQREPEPAILFNGAHHGNECITPEICISLLKALLAGSGTPAVRRWIDSLQVFIVPMVNPDGHEVNFLAGDTWWRKNTRDNNSNGYFDHDDGVNLNRNYDFFWENAPSLSTSNNYRGPSPLSEPETRGLADLARRERFAIDVCYHSSRAALEREVVFYPWTWDQDNAPDHQFLHPIAQTYAQSMPNDAGTGTYTLGVGDVTFGGAFRNWAYYSFGTFAYTPEVSFGYYQPPSRVDSICARVNQGSYYLLNRLLGAGVWGRVLDSAGGAPISAQVTLVGVDTPGIHAILPRSSDSLTGAFFRLLNPGSYSFIVTHPDYDTALIGPTLVAADQPTAIDVRLARRRDVGVRSLVLPAAVDSLQSFAPACTVRNFGRSTESYQVRMRIGAFYDTAVSIADHPGRTDRYVTFPEFADWPRGTHAATCSTELNRDRDPANDRQQSSLPVRVRDIGPARIIAPTGLIDSTQLLAPVCSIWNPGNTVESYLVRLRIDGLDEDSVLVTGHEPGTATEAAFAPRRNWPRGTHAVACSTLLAGDLVPANDAAADSFRVAVRDVGVFRIEVPNVYAESGTTLTPACSVHSWGTESESFPVAMLIDTFYAETSLVTDLAPGATRFVTFPDWHVLERGHHTVQSATCLASDMRPVNNSHTIKNFVRAREVIVTRILSPRDTVDSGQTRPVSAVVTNLGNAPDMIQVRLRIGSVYDRAVSKSLPPGVTDTADFPAWTVGARGWQPVTCAIESLNHRPELDNELADSVFCRVRDVAAVTILSPRGRIDSAQTVPVRTEVRNRGNTPIACAAFFQAGAYLESLAVGLEPDQLDTLDFPALTAGTRGAYSTVCFVNLVGDANPGNDTVGSSFMVQVRDVGLDRIVAPAGELDSGAAVVPELAVSNPGSIPVAFPVRLVIAGPAGTVYEDSIRLVLAPGRSALCSLPAWLPPNPDTYRLLACAALDSDLVRRNDTARGSVIVRRVARPDVGVAAIIAPRDSVPIDTSVAPRAVVRNYGNTVATFAVRFRIDSTYDASDTVSALAPGTSDTIEFPAWTAGLPGWHFTSCSTLLAGDQNPDNDAARDSVLVYIYSAIAQEETNLQLPTAFALTGCAPNPFTTRTVVSLALPAAGRVTLDIFSTTGRLVHRQELDCPRPGYFRVDWNGRDEQRRTVPAGIYACRVRTGSGSAGLKLIKLAR